MDERIDAFLTAAQTERSLSPHTVSAYRNDLRQFAEFLEAEGARSGGSAVPVSSVDRELLGGYFLHLRERGYSPGDDRAQGSGPQVVFPLPAPSGEIAVDPTDGIGSPEVKKAPPVAISADAVQALISYADQRDTPEGRRASAMLRLMYAYRMRVSELVTLDVSDITSRRARCGWLVVARAPGSCRSTHPCWPRLATTSSTPASSWPVTPRISRRWCSTIAVSG